MYEIFISPIAERYFKKIKDKALRKEFENALKKISIDPYIGNPKKGDLLGVYGYDVKYNKTKYEIAYNIHEAEGKKVIILLTGTRENFYKQLKRYLK